MSAETLPHLAIIDAMPDAEQGLLLALLADSHGDAASWAYATVRPEHLASRPAAQILAAMAEVYDAGDEVEPLTVSYMLQRHGTLGDVGGSACVCELAGMACTAANTRVWGSRVLEAARARGAVDALDSAKRRVSRGESNVEGAIADLVEVSTWAGDGSEKAAVGIKRLLQDGMRDLERRMQEDEPPGVKTGLADLDKRTGGHQPGELTILAGRPSMGKTALALLFARAAAEREKPALVISLEMSKDQLRQRLLSMASGVTSAQFRAPKTIRPEQYAALARANEALHELPLEVIDVGMAAHDIAAAARDAKRRHGLGLVVVDYLQLVTVPEKGHSREREVADISAALKRLAKDLSVPVVCLAQLNRATEQQEGKVPRLSNLRESGSLEQDADVVLFVHRAGYYNPKEPQDAAQIFIAKNRNGEVGCVDVNWCAERTLFRDKDWRR